MEGKQHIVMSGEDIKVCKGCQQSVCVLCRIKSDANNAESFCLPCYSTDKLGAYEDEDKLSIEEMRKQLGDNGWELDVSATASEVEEIFDAYLQKNVLIMSLLALMMSHSPASQHLQSTNLNHQLTNYHLHLTRLFATYFFRREGALFLMHQSQPKCFLLSCIYFRKYSNTKKVLDSQILIIKYIKHCQLTLWKWPMAPGWIRDFAFFGVVPNIAWIQT